jgi:hypothetical protein
MRRAADPARIGCPWVPALRRSVKSVAPRPGHVYLGAALSAGSQS